MVTLHLITALLVISLLVVGWLFKPPPRKQRVKVRVTGRRRPNQR